MKASQNMCGELAPPQWTIEERAAQFKHGNRKMTDSESVKLKSSEKKCASNVRTRLILAEVWQLFTLLQIWLLALVCGITWRERLGIAKTSSRWAPKMLPPEIKREAEETGSIQPKYHDSASAYEETVFTMTTMRRSISALPGKKSVLRNERQAEEGGHLQMLHLCSFPSSYSSLLSPAFPVLNFYQRAQFGTSINYVFSSVITCALKLAPVQASVNVPRYVPITLMFKGSAPGNMGTSLFL